MGEKNFSSGQMELIRLLADGQTVEQATEILKADPYLIPNSELEAWIRTPEILQAAIDRSSDLLGQAWGTMWHSIKQKAMLGSVQHSKLLIEFVSNGKKLGDNTLRLIFDDAVAGRKKFEDEGVSDGY